MEQGFEAPSGETGLKLRSRTIPRTAVAGRDGVPRGRNRATAVHRSLGGVPCERSLLGQQGVPRPEEREQTFSARDRSARVQRDADGGFMRGGDAAAAAGAAQAQGSHGSPRPHGWLFPSVHPRGGPEVLRLPNRVEVVQDGRSSFRLESRSQTVHIADAACGAGDACTGQRVAEEATGEQATEEWVAGGHSGFNFGL